MSAQTECRCPSDEVPNPYCPVHPALFAPDSEISDARYGLAVALRELPYAGQLPPPPAIDCWQSESDFLDEVSKWVTEFGKVLATVRTTYVESLEELEEFRRLRAGLRKVFGQIGEP